MLAMLILLQAAAAPQPPRNLQGPWTGRQSILRNRPIDPRGNGSQADGRTGRAKFRDGVTKAGGAPGCRRHASSAVPPIA